MVKRKAHFPPLETAECLHACILQKVYDLLTTATASDLLCEHWKFDLQQWLHQLFLYRALLAVRLSWTFEKDQTSVLQLITISCVCQTSQIH